VGFFPLGVSHFAVGDPLSELRFRIRFKDRLEEKRGDREEDRIAKVSLH